MQIDWITVSAQIINFLILVWLLKHFLYQPVIHAMDRREQRVSQRLDDARAREREADEQRARYEDEREKLEQRQEALLSEAQEQAEREKRQLLQEAREQVAETRTNWQRQARQEKQEFLDNLQHQAVEAIQSIARRALRDLADRALEASIVDNFLQRLKSLEPKARDSLLNDAESIRITSAFELDAPVRGRLTRALHEQLAKELEVEYQVAPELLCGIQLSSGGQRLSWNLAEYLEELDERLQAAFSPLESATREE